MHALQLVENLRTLYHPTFKDKIKTCKNISYFPNDGTNPLYYATLNKLWKYYKTTFIHGGRHIYKTGENIRKHAHFTYAASREIQLNNGNSAYLHIYTLLDPEIITPGTIDYYSHEIVFFTKERTIVDPTKQIEGYFSMHMETNAGNVAFPQHLGKRIINNKGNTHKAQK